MFRLLRLFIVAVILVAFLPKQSALNNDGAAVYHQFLADNTQFHQQVEQLTAYVATNAPDDSLKAAFRRSRLAYKRMEWLLEYYQPFLASHINGPPVVEVEGNEPGQTPILPSGLQVVETYLFPDYSPTRKAELSRELTVLLTYSTRLEQGIPEGKLSDADILTAIQQQLFRITTLGITGYDAPEARTGLTEAAASLAALQSAFRPYASQLPKAMSAQLGDRWEEAILVLGKAKDFDAFDRITFIRQQLYPLCRALTQARQTLHIPAGARNRFLSPTVATLSDTGAFRPDHLINFGEFISTPQKVALGRLLFFDPLLSGNNARSCASCHQPERAFTDGRARSRSFKGRKQVLRNAPTLINAGLQNAQFYDSRALYLEDQAHDVLSNAHEMRTSPDEVVSKLATSAAYRKMFAEAFPNGLTAPAVRNSLAAYIRSLTRLNARPDRYLRGDSVALSEEEKRGFNLFLGKARCATCHFFPIFNGFAPPHYEKTESEIIGVPRSPKTRNARLDTDVGKFGTYQKNIHRFAFKTPTVRNVALTAPYMHNGVYKTLEQVVDFYNRGGGRGIGISLDGQTLPEAPLNLTAVEQKAVVAFLNALTDTTGLTQRPNQLPLIDQPTNLNRRKPGGRY
ncbi:cytochrome-c peroxidase [Spirosoma linguale]|uniref:Cytochrome-c peroxidase n=1 Tax=Spirosoma linguale (strain ATCC 33905 / DSM 74 / LMG 10896 / Claus 1) TaxID=504472 RepID=D2QJ31_SPILD|nr:Cytochrome-c peroxidase [Spirosoma linguale DSM 74]